MSWYAGTFYCGHEGYVNIIGPASNREKMKEYKFSGLCPACCKAELVRSRNEKNTAARKAASRMELPPLEGTRKQVVWAETLRVEALTRLQTFIDTPGNIHLIILRLNYEALTPLELTEENLPPMLQEIVQYLIHEKVKAAYWINNRFNRSCAIWNSSFRNIWNGANGIGPSRQYPNQILYGVILSFRQKIRNFRVLWKSKAMMKKYQLFMKKMTGSAKLSGRWTTNGMAAAGSGGLPLTGAPSGIVPQSWEMYC